MSGTLGVLSRLVAMRALSVTGADELLAGMIRAGYRCPVASLTEIL